MAVDVARSTKLAHNTAATKNCPANFQRCQRTLLRFSYNASWIHVAALLLYLVHAAAATNLFYSFTDCDKPQNDVYDVDGAAVTSQTQGVPISNRHNCTYFFQAKVPYRNFLLQITELNVACGVDSLTVYEPSASIASPYYILQNFCGTLPDLPGYFNNGKIYSVGSLLRITWRTGQRSNRGQDLAFKFTLTAVTADTGTCDSSRHQFACSQDCISDTLLCDGVPHCMGGQDELQDCPVPDPPLGALSLTAAQESTTTKKQSTNGNNANPTTPRPFMGNEEIFLWLPLVVVVIFTCVMIGLITIGRRKEANNNESTNDDRNGLSIDISGNNAYEPEPGMPHTPPPSYSILERQISYVSHISQSSSQIEEPPDYTDALEYPEEGGRPVRSASAFRDRHRSNSAGSRLARLRGRLFSRSVSATEPRYSRRNDSSASAENPDIAENPAENPDIVENPSEIHEGHPGARESDSSDVFVTFTAGPQDHSTPHPSSTSSQSTTQTSIPSPRVNLNSTHLTTISSIDEGDLNASTPSIFDHIHRLNEPDSEIDEVGDMRGLQSQNEASSGSRGSRDGSGTGSASHISEMALLTNDGTPNVGSSSRN